MGPLQIGVSDGSLQATQAPAVGGVEILSCAFAVSQARECVGGGLACGAVVSPALPGLREPERVVSADDGHCTAVYAHGDISRHADPVVLASAMAITDRAAGR